MIQLKNILKNTDAKLLAGDGDNFIKNLTSSSKSVEKDFAFFALKGTNTDGHKYIEAAIKSGATAIVCSEDPQSLIEGITYYITKNGNNTWAHAAANFYNNPSEKIELIGVTGTNGKTTTATLLYKLLNKLGYKTGLISTIRYIAGNNEYNATHTTPDALVINKLLKEMVDSSCKYCIMEVSSHSVIQGRIDALVFKGGVFTNLTHDHLDYHKTFAEYLRAKQLFFDSLSKTSFAIYNTDDPNGKVMVQHTTAQTHDYAINRPAEFKTKIIQNTFEGLCLDINGTETWFKLVGKFNAYNISAIFATATICGISKENILIALSSLNEVDGRFNVINSKRGIIGIVDYAHTPDALENVLNTICEINNNNGNIITVAGAGGDRDKSKRPKMGKIIAKLSDRAIITSDNPRTENPDEIIEEVKSGIETSDLKKTVCIKDRSEAIKTACMLAKQGDIILVAGKGHETYQEINGVRNHFNDLEQLNEFLNT